MVDLVDIENKCLNDYFNPSSEVKNSVKQYIKASLDYNGFDNKVYGEKCEKNQVRIVLW